MWPVGYTINIVMFRLAVMSENIMLRDHRSCIQSNSPSSQYHSTIDISKYHNVSHNKISINCKDIGWINIYFYLCFILYIHCTCYVMCMRMVSIVADYARWLPDNQIWYLLECYNLFSVCTIERFVPSMFYF